jgi:hypothetical protein
MPERGLVPHSWARYQNGAYPNGVAFEVEFAGHDGRVAVCSLWNAVKSARLTPATLLTIAHRKAA